MKYVIKIVIGAVWDNIIRPKFMTQLSISILYDLFNKKALHCLKKSDFGFRKIRKLRDFFLKNSSVDCAFVEFD